MSVAPRSPKGPPVTALRAFEAAARLGGFAAAAEELCVTAGAISAHVKALEDDLGAPLFDRQTRGVKLTPLGARVLPDLSAAFDRLGMSVQMLRAEAGPRQVHIATLPAIAQPVAEPAAAGDPGGAARCHHLHHRAGAAAEPEARAL
ncbi:hypothetical protein FALB51S_01199 [Frigidibacter albus]